MIYLYQSANEKHNLVKVGLTTSKKRGRARIGDYTRSNNLPTKGWSTPQHFALDTDDWAAARAVEKDVHDGYKARGKTIRKGGRTVREAFKGTASGVRWATLAAAKSSGLYKKGG